MNTKIERSTGRVVINFVAWRVKDFAGPGAANVVPVKKFAKVRNLQREESFGSCGLTCASCLVMARRPPSQSSVSSSTRLTQPGVGRLGHRGVLIRILTDRNSKHLMKKHCLQLSIFNQNRSIFNGRSWVEIFLSLLK